MQTRCGYHLNDGSFVRYALAMVKVFLNDAYKYYYNRLVDAGCKRILTTDDLDLTADTETVALPSDFYFIYKLSRILTNDRIPLKYSSDLGSVKYTSGSATGDGYLPKYDVQGTNLLLNPTPAADETDALWLEYYPTITEMVGDSTTTATGFSSQWHPLIPLRAAYVIKSIREDENTSNLERLLRTEESDFNKYISKITKQRKRTDRFVI